MNTYSLSILHASWVPDRRHSLRHLADLIEQANKSVVISIPPVGYDKSDLRGYFDDMHYARIMWALESGCSHHVFLDDDMLPDNMADEYIRRMIRARPAAVMGLHTNHPNAPKLHAEGHRWYRTNAWVCGGGFIMPTDLLAQFNTWWCSAAYLYQPKHEMYDTAINTWVSSEGPKEVYHPLPSPFRHVGKSIVRPDAVDVYGLSTCDSLAINVGDLNAIEYHTSAPMLEVP